MARIEQTVRERLLAGEDPATVASDLGLDVETSDSNDVGIILPGWVADDGNAEVAYPDAESGLAAAKEYVQDGDWGKDRETIWIRVHTWQVVLSRDEDGEVVESDTNRDEHTIGIAPEEPDCVEDRDHDWQSPISVVGGIAENPGVSGHGGGVIATEVCAHCGVYRILDTWAQDPATGEQGLESLTYKDPDEESLTWVERRKE